MPRGVNDLEVDSAGPDVVALFRRGIDLGWGWKIDAEEEASGFLHPVEQRPVVVVQHEGCSGQRAQSLGRDDVVEMSVRRDDGCDRQPLLGDLGRKLVGVPAGIDHDRLARGLLTNDIAVALEGAHRAVQEELQNQALIYLRTDRGVPWWEEPVDRGRTHAAVAPGSVSYTHLRAHETDSYLVCRLL